jgi:hypothetical protein
LNTPLKSPTDFEDVREWRAYVRANASAEEADYILARGRTALYLRFYGMRNHPVPEAFQKQLRQLDERRSPERAIELEALNARIFADMTELLFAELPQRSNETESVVPTTPGEIAQELLEHLERANPYFATWVRYEAHGQRANCALFWHEFAARERSSSTKEDLQFTLLMGQLGPLLRHYVQRNLPLPPRTRYAIWFLHYVEHPVRNAQTRALLATLLEALESCGFA